MGVQIIQMMGGPGSGKGVQAALLAEKIGAKIVSPGTEFRNLVTNGHRVGIRFKEAMEAGELAPSWLAEYIFERELFSIHRDERIVFESGCRKRPEAELFDEINRWLGLTYKVLFLDVSKEEMTRRLDRRRELENRPDDNAVDVRIERYVKETTPSVEFFTQKGTLAHVNGEQSVEAVQQDILKALGL